MSLRKSAGLSAKTFQAATVGLANSLFAIQTTHSPAPDMTLGMVRIIGDGRFFSLIIDVAVLPAHHGKGVGK